MRHIGLLSVGGALSGLLCYGYSARTGIADADPLDTVLIQLPNATSIRQELVAKPGLTQTQRQDLFAELFTQRFRAHDSKIAIRARFVETSPGHTRIKMMYPARMEPWNMDRIALVAWRESRGCLGRAYDIDIYETYIGALPHKIGELHNSGDKMPTASICYISEAERAALNPGSCAVAWPGAFQTPRTAELSAISRLFADARKGSRQLTPRRFHII